MAKSVWRLSLDLHHKGLPIRSRPVSPCCSPPHRATAVSVSPSLSLRGASQRLADYDADGDLDLSSARRPYGDRLYATMPSAMDFGRAALPTSRDALRRVGNYDGDGVRPARVFAPARTGAQALIA